MNRHYLKMADPERIAKLSVPYFVDAGVAMTPDAARHRVPGPRDGDGDRRRSIGSNQVPARLGVPVRLRCRRQRWTTRRCGARWTRTAPARSSPRWPRSWRRRRGSTARRFRAVGRSGEDANRTEGAALFHPIRVALTGRAEGPELDLAVPAIDRGAELPARRAGDCRAGGRLPASGRPACSRPVAGLRARPMLIYGINPVLEAARGPRARRSACRRARDERVAALLELARSSGVTVAARRAGELDRLRRRRRAPGRGRRHARARIM